MIVVNVIHRFSLAEMLTDRRLVNVVGAIGFSWE